MPNIQIPLQVTVSLAEHDLVKAMQLFCEIVTNRRLADPKFNIEWERSHKDHAVGQSSKKQGLMIDMNQVAEILKVSPRTVWRMKTQGDMPVPIQFGRAVRWSLEEIRQWVNAGCPKRDEWEKRWHQRIKKN